MLSTPADYKNSANQTVKARAAAQAQQKPPLTTGTNPDRKNASYTAAAASRGDAAGRSSSVSDGTDSSGATLVAMSEMPLGAPATTSKPFTTKNGRKCLRDPTLLYPLPCDLAEINRQTMRTMMLCQAFNGPICSPVYKNKHPKRVLEVGCGTGFWSVMCHRYFAQRGITTISFTGIDIAPLASGTPSAEDMNWRFVQHDLRRVPLPFRDDEFNLIMVKDLSMVTPNTGIQQNLMDEYLRCLKPGGTLEIWDGDHSLRLLQQHAPPSTMGDDGETENEEQLHANAMGIYTLTAHTPLNAPQNQYILEYNSWISKALEARRLTPVPCTDITPMLLQESEDLVEIDSRRLAIPLGEEVRWEREGVGVKGKVKDTERKLLTTGQAALRRTALLTVVQMIESLEPILREASGKGQDEWDRWQGNMMTDLLKNKGTSWGECLEVGAWWARKKK